LRRLQFGVVALILLAIPAVLHSHAAIEGLMNRPPDWLPDELPEKQVFNEFIHRFDVIDLVMASWDDATLDSLQLDAVTEVLRLLTVEEGVATDATVDADDIAVIMPVGYAIEEARLIAIAGRVNEILREHPDRSIEKTDPPFRAETAGPEPSGFFNPHYPLIWARSGQDTVERMMASPANFPRAVAVGRLQGAIVGPDGRQTCVLVALTETGSDHRRDLLADLRELIATVIDIDESRRDEIVLVGGPVDGATVDQASVDSVQFFAPLSAALAVLLCLFCLRSIPLTAVIVAIAVISEGLVMAAVYYTGTPMNAVLIVLPPLVFVLTISSGIHLSNYFLDVSHEFADLTPAMAAGRAMRTGTTPCLLAAGTTVIGLGSLTLVRLEPIRVFGFVASIGVISSLLLLLLCLPGAMVISGAKFRDQWQLARTRRFPRLADQAERLRGVYQRFIRNSLLRPWPMIIVFALITTGMSQGLPRLETSVSVPRMFLPSSFLRQQHDWFEANVGATVSGDLLVSFPKIASDGDDANVPDDEDRELVDPLDQLRIVQQIHKTTLDDRRVSSVLSAATFVPPVSRSRGLAGSTSRSVARSLIRDPESSLGTLGFISHGDDDLVWRVSFRLPQKVEADFGTDLRRLQTAVAATLAQTLQKVELDEEVADEIEFSLTGQVAIVQKAQEVMLRDLFRSFLAAFGVVAVVMVLVLKNVLGGIIAMIPNLFPTVTIFGIMGLMRTPLDIGSVMTASVALGIAVDDTVHLLSRFGSRRARGLSRRRSAFGALDQCGTAMLQTTLVCGLSLMVYWFSDFVPTSRFSVLMFCLLSAALLGDVFLLPALMASRLGNLLSRSVGVDPEAALTHESDKDEHLEWGDEPEHGAETSDSTDTSNRNVTTEHR